MHVANVEWTETEQVVARQAFDKAQCREIEALILSVRHQAAAIAVPEDMWRLHDFLSTQRHEVDGKYDYRYAGLVFVFARLVKEGWLQVNELEGLSTDKLAKVSALSRM
jgi:Photoprotection regulator fluorescence recovery protein